MITERNLEAVVRTKRRDGQRPLNPVRWATGFDPGGVNNLAQVIATVSATLLGVLIGIRLRSAPTWAIGIDALVYVVAILMILTTMRRRDNATSNVPVQPVDKPRTKKKGKQGKTPRTQTGNELRITRDEHLAIAGAEGTYRGNNAVPEAIKSPKPEGEPKMPGLSTLPVAVGYQEKLALLKSRLSNLDQIPAPPQYISDGAMYIWNDRALEWLEEAQTIMTEAFDLASIRERNTHLSGQLSEAKKKADAGLARIRDLAYHPDESTDISQFSRYCQVTKAALADIVAYAEGL